MQKKIYTLSWIMLNIFMPHTTYAGAFSLYTESSAAAVGDFAAGIAAEGADASIGWYNPAGLILLKTKNAVLSGVGVLPHTQISGTSIFATDTYPSYEQSFQNLSGAESAVVPALHYAQPLGSRAAYGVSLVVPFGLATDWGLTSPVRYAATRTQMSMLNASPQLGGFVSDHVSVGLGLDFQWARVTFNSVLGSPASLAYLESVGGLVTPTYLDSTSTNQGDSFGLGFHAGILGMYNEQHTRLGLNYQSGINHTFSGHSTLRGRLADPELTDPNAIFYSGALQSNNVALPDILTLSAYQDVTTHMTLLASAVYTGWSVLKTIELKNIAAFSPDEGKALVNVTTINDYQNTWRFALGGKYLVNEQWTVRAGGGYDQTPTINAQRDVRLPDSNRWALSIGTHYQPRPHVGVDLGYTYLFSAGRAHINKTQMLGETSANTIQAIAQNHAQLVGVQVVWTS